ncbi:hypothetical protein [Sphingomonas sp. GM_Shp_1]|uniref:hypothetical protein n=1 Tax=Sphingomonas sp. GM_Shp_1 TaxID=2937381 RepID=UPI00226B26F1|nr:hypothetical protein [Sphingomonas sp. GM_Shp_1]
MGLGKTGWAALMAAGLLALGGCADGYGYSGVSVGSGFGGGYGPGYYGYGGGYGYAPSYYGWYNDFYYPGTGIYVYDRYRRPYRWNDGQRAYWEGRRGAWRGGPIRDQWRGWGRDGWRGDRWRGQGWRGNGAVAPTPGVPRAEGWRGNRGTPGGGRGGPRPGGPRGSRGPR